MINRFELRQIHVATPLWFSDPLTATAGADVFLKMEALQPVGSFKARGMGAACRASYEAGVKNVVCASGGNAGYAVAYAGRQLGLKVTIVVPVTTNSRAKELILSQDADLIVHGSSWDDANSYAIELAESLEGEYIHPFDDPKVWHGHAGIVEEIAEDGLKPGILVVAVGGGGLLCGILEGLHKRNWDDIPVVAVETKGAASLAASIEAGKLVTLEKIDSVATTLGAKQVTPKALAWTKDHEIIPWTVSDRDAVSACLRFADDHRLLVEPACGAALSVPYNRAPIINGRGPVVVIVCGGAGVTRELLESWYEQLE
jgi:L-serine/L-threonine ammonia-lyase